MEGEIVAAIHAARSQPLELSKRIRQRLAHLKGKEYFPPERGGKVAVVTKEGKAAIEDALEYLKKQAILQSTDPLPAIAEPTPGSSFHAVGRPTALTRPSSSSSCARAASPTLTRRRRPASPLSPTRDSRRPRCCSTASCTR